MAIDYTIQAQIVDIRKDSPRSEDIFLVDTNVWYWHAYTNANVSALDYQQLIFLLSIQPVDRFLNAAGWNIVLKSLNDCGVKKCHSGIGFTD